MFCPLLVKTVAKHFSSCTQAYSLTEANRDIATMWGASIGTNKLVHATARTIVCLGSTRPCSDPASRGHAEPKVCTKPALVSWLEPMMKPGFSHWLGSLEGTLLGYLQTCQGSHCFEVSADGLQVHLRLDRLRVAALS